MPWRRSVSVAGVLLALTPAAAGAQSAGDEQYEDPFANQQPQAQATPAPAADPAQATATPAPPAQATPTPATPAPAPAAAAQPAAGAAPAQAELPRTGGDARLAALLGLGLLSAGVALRAHARRAR
jgi:hypothetical protein